MWPRISGEEPLVTEPTGHLSVLLDETLELLAPRPGDIVVDATLGAGGHAEALAEAIGPRGRLIGIDRDPAALGCARTRLARFGEAFVAVHGEHSDLARIVEDAGHTQVDRILFDLGVSSMQLDDPERGFSFREDGPLDMRMDPSAPRTAADLLAESSELELRELLWRFGEERHARAIVRAILRERERRPLVRTSQLAGIVEAALGPAARRFRIHPATRTFQALRIATNGEVVGLAATIRAAVGLLRTGGRLALIAFHSLEDRAVKHALRDLAPRCSCPPGLPVCSCGRPGLVRVVTPRPRVPGAAEVAANPRARSAKLRAAEKL